MNKLTDVFKALSDRNRFRVVAALLQHDELCACQITELIQVTGATASRHMSVLIASELVDSRKEGRWVYYRLRREDPNFEGLINWVNERVCNDTDLANDSEALDVILSCDPEELCRKQRGEKCC